MSLSEFVAHTDEYDILIGQTQKKSTAVSVNSSTSEQIYQWKNQTTSQ